MRLAAAQRHRAHGGTGLSHDDANFGEDECCQPSVQGRDQGKYTAPVGSFAPNPFGLYDVIGNVWEWVDDCWNESYVDARPTDPRGKAEIATNG